VSLSELREEHLSSINVFKSLISNIQPGLYSNNFVPYINRYNVFYEKYMPIKTLLSIGLYDALFTLRVLFWTRTTHLPSLKGIWQYIFLLFHCKELLKLYVNLNFKCEARSHARHPKHASHTWILQLVMFRREVSIEDQICASILYCIYINHLKAYKIIASHLHISKSRTRLTKSNRSPRADGAKRRARVLIPPGYLHPGKRKH
jgi:hypothetical protein